MRTYPRRLHHQVPPWVESGARFHVRLRASAVQHPGLTEPMLALDLLRSARRDHHLGRWWCELFLLMPDHVHALLSFPADASISETVRNWKRGTTRLQRVSWQDGFFDHRLRSVRELEEAWTYIRFNPVVKSLCPSEGLWPWWWSATVENPLLPIETA